MTGIYGLDRDDVLSLIAEIWNKTVEKARGEESQMLTALHDVLDEELEKIADQEFESLKKAKEKVIEFKKKKRIPGTKRVPVARRDKNPSRKT